MFKHIGGYGIEFDQGQINYSGVIDYTYKDGDTHKEVRPILNQAEFIKEAKLEIMAMEIGDRKVAEL